MLTTSPQRAAAKTRTNTALPKHCPARKSSAKAHPFQNTGGGGDDAPGGGFRSRARQRHKLVERVFRVGRAAFPQTSAHALPPACRARRPAGVLSTAWRALPSNNGGGGDGVLFGGRRQLAQPRSTPCCSPPPPKRRRRLPRAHACTVFPQTPPSPGTQPNPPYHTQPQTNKATRVF